MWMKRGGGGAVWRKLAFAQNHQRKCLRDRRFCTKKLSWRLRELQIFARLVRDYMENEHFSTRFTRIFRRLSANWEKALSLMNTKDPYKYIKMGTSFYTWVWLVRQSSGPLTTCPSQGLQIALLCVPIAESRGHRWTCTLNKWLFLGWHIQPHRPIGF